MLAPRFVGDAHPAAMAHFNLPPRCELPPMIPPVPELTAFWEVQKLWTALL